MKHFIATAVMASSLLFGANALAASSPAALKESSPEQSGDSFKYSTDTKIAAEQKNVYGTIINYQNALNAGDTKTILDLFADESYSQWNDKLTADNTEKRQGQYDELFVLSKINGEWKIFLYTFNTNPLQGVA